MAHFSRKALTAAVIIAVSQGAYAAQGGFWGGENLCF